MNSIEFEERSLHDLDGNEWLISGEFESDVDSEGEATDERIINIKLIPMNEDDKRDFTIKNDSEMPDFIPQQEINDLMDELREKLYNELMNGEHESQY